MDPRKASFKQAKVLGKVTPSLPFSLSSSGKLSAKWWLLQKMRTLSEGFKVATNALSVSHLQFADDILIFCEAREDQVRNIKATLICFEAVSGMKIIFF